MGTEILSPENLKIIEEARELSICILNLAGRIDQEENPNIKFFEPRRSEICQHDLSLGIAVRKEMKDNLFFPGSKFEEQPRLKVEGELDKMSKLRGLRITLFVRRKRTEPIVSLIVPLHRDAHPNKNCLLFWRKKKHIFDLRAFDLVFVEDYAKETGPDCNILNKVIMPCLRETKKMVESDYGTKQEPS